MTKRDWVMPASTAIGRRSVAAGLGVSLCAPAIVRAQGSPPIIVGEINAYSAQPAFTLPYRNGWMLALDQINGAGGVLGRKLAFVSRDDAGRPQDAVRAAAELLGEAKVDLLAGTYLSNVALAVSDYARQNQTLFVAAEPLTDALIWDKGNRYTFRLRPGTYEQAKLLAGPAAKLGAKRWATVAPNYEYGQSAVKWFKQFMAALQPGVAFVAEQWPALGRIDAGATAQALEEAKPDAIFNVTFGADLTNFVRQGNTRGLFEKRAVVSMLTGEPEYLDPLGDETPEGWIVTGYPWDTLATAEHKAFAAAYRERYAEAPKMGSVVGYALVRSIVAGLTAAKSTTIDAMVAGFEGAQFETPFGPAQFRTADHQSTLGAFVGTLALQNGRGTMADWRYAGGSEVLPPESEARQLRPA